MDSPEYKRYEEVLLECLSLKDRMNFYLCAKDDSVSQADPQEACYMSLSYHKAHESFIFKDASCMANGGNIRS